jgi:hypothetical protein
MGYTSQVFIGIPKEENENLINLNFESLCDNRKLINSYGFKNMFKLKKETKDGMLIYESVWELKWYDYFQDVKIITEFMDKLYDEDKEVFAIAIGEDQVVHSEIGSYYDYIEIYLCVNIKD